jgi:outer membrane protein OmpA-like peptidoglycan-associated protein/tetratricopeptide (TPR) repeat protein
MNKLILIGLFLLPLVSIGQDEDCFFEPDKKQEKALQSCIDLIRSGQEVAGIECLQDLVEEPGIGMEALWLSGEAAYRAGLSNRAIADLEKLTEACPAYQPEAWYLLGMAQFYSEDYKTAANSLQNYLDEGPQNPDYESEAITTLERAKLFDKILTNPVPYDPRPVKDISSELDEYLPAISPDNAIMLFTRGNYKIDKKPYGSEKIRVEEFSIAERKGEVFEKGVPLPKPFNKGLNEGGASITIDNNEVFVTICNAPDGLGSCDIYSSRFEGTGWTELENLGYAINDSNWQSQVSIAADKKTLYFTSDREGGLGGKDIWISKRDSTGAWTPAVNAGPVINSEFDEQSPFIHPDDNTLYFSSNNPKYSIGGYDILISRKSAGSGFGTPENIGYPINSFNDDFGFFVSTDGKTAYFASNKLDVGPGGYDIYEFPLYAGARPKKLLFVKGQILDESGKVLTDVTIELKDLKTNEIKKIEIDSVTGKYIINEHFENDQLMIVNREGYFYGSQVIKKDDEQFESPGQLDYKLQQLKLGSAYRVKNILFDTDSYIIADESKLELQGLIRFMELNPKIKIEISGHTDNVGDDQSNLTLSKNRAEAVRNFVVAGGIDGARVSHKGYGETKPVAGNDTEQGRAKNRRTEVKILGF